MSLLVTWAIVLVCLGRAGATSGSSTVRDQAVLQGSLTQDDHTQDDHTQDDHTQESHAQGSLTQDDHLQDSLVYYPEKIGLTENSIGQAGIPEDTLLQDAFNLEEWKLQFGIKHFLETRWPNNTVPVILCDKMAMQYRPEIYKAMNLLSTLTCLKFVNSTDTQKYYLNITYIDNSCYAHLGFQNHQIGYQLVNLCPNCFYGFGVIVHELIHSSSFHHQQVRIDRDDYVNVYRDRIDKEAYSNFQKHDYNPYDYLWTFGLPYDYNSVMHYPADAFALSTDHVPTIAVKREFLGMIGQRDGPSRTDIAALNRYYECWDHYLGDDIPDSVPYTEFHARYIKRNLTKSVSEKFTKWFSYMTEKVTK